MSPDFLVRVALIFRRGAFGNRAFGILAIKIGDKLGEHVDYSSLINSKRSFIDSGSSVALTVPAIPTGQPAKGAVHVGILTAQGAAQWLRTDGVAVTAAVTGGLKLNIGDYRIIYGISNLRNVRVIRDAAGGALAVEYYYFRPRQP